MIDLSEVRNGRPGGLRLVLMRFLTLVVLTAPTALVARQGLVHALGSDPRIVELGITETAAMAIARELAPSVAAALLAGVVLFVVFQQLLDATALQLLDANAEDRSGRLWRTMWDDSWRHVLPFVRVYLVSLALVAAGFAGFGLMFSKLGDFAATSGWRADQRLLVLAGGRALVYALWFQFVGALARWARTLIVADGRRRVRRVLPLAMRCAWRTPFRTATYFVFVPLLVQVLGGVILGHHVATAEFDSIAGSAMHGGIWLGFLLLQSTVWYVLLHRARVMLREDRFDRIRAGSDERWSALFGRRARPRPARPTADAS